MLRLDSDFQRRMSKKLQRLIPILPSARRERSDFQQMRLRHVVAVEQPLVLISQANRSGGTLLAQLFAGHPSCHVHPGELHIGHPRKTDWPVLDLSAGPDRWFRQLVEDRLAQYARHGFSKPGRQRGQYSEADVVFPFVFLRRFQREVFRTYLKSRDITSQRTILDAYHTSYFNAWLDYQGLYMPEKKYVVGFTPRLSSNETSVERFFQDYPDGRLISVVRDPKSWFVSLRGKKPEQRKDPRESVERWKVSAAAALANSKRYGSRVRVIGFERLLQNTEKTMRELADFLDMPFHESLTRPTFQGMDIRANSTFVAKQAGVLDGPLARSRELSPEDTAAIEEETSDLYASVSEEIERTAGS